MKIPADAWKKSANRLIDFDERQVFKLVLR